jgi:hypothetical protein
MITTDQLEVLLRTVPQYLMFGGLSLYLLGWIYRKALYLTIAEIIFSLIGLLSIIVISSGMIPSPLAEGIVKEHVEMVIKILTYLSLNGLLALASIVIRLLRRKTWRPLPFIIFAFSMYIFFISTSMSKIKFELNHPPSNEQQISETEK